MFAGGNIIFWYYTKPSFALAYRIFAMSGLGTLLVTAVMVGYLYLEGRLLADREFWLTLAFLLFGMGAIVSSLCLSIACIIRIIWRTKLPDRGFYQSSLVPVVCLIEYLLLIGFASVVMSGGLPEWYVPL